MKTLATYPGSRPGMMMSSLAVAPPSAALMMRTAAFGRGQRHSHVTLIQCQLPLAAGPQMLPGPQLQSRVSTPRPSLAVLKVPEVVHVPRPARAVSVTLPLLGLAVAHPALPSRRRRPTLRRDPRLASLPLSLPTLVTDFGIK